MKNFHLNIHSCSRAVLCLKLSGPNLQRTLMLIASTDPCCVLTKGTLMWHHFSTNIRMQLNWENLPSSFGFLCSAAAAECEYMVPVISDQINDAIELRAVLATARDFWKRCRLPAQEDTVGMGMEVEEATSWILSGVISLPWGEKFPYCYWSTWHLAGLFQKPHTVPHDNCNCMWRLQPWSVRSNRHAVVMH